MCGFCLVVELAQGGIVSSTPSSLNKFLRWLRSAYWLVALSLDCLTVNADYNVSLVKRMKKKPNENSS